MSPYIPIQLQRTFRQHFKNRCAYCQTSEALIATRFEMDHIQPRSTGGETCFENLCLACPHCNRHKSDRETFRDPESHQTVSLFHPQQQVWQKHFVWNEDSSVLLGLTASGRATLEVLEINRPALVHLRKLWRKFGEHPPKD